MMSYMGDNSSATLLFDKYSTFLTSTLSENEISNISGGFQRIRNQKNQFHENGSETQEERKNCYLASGDALEYLFFTKLSNVTNDKEDAEDLQSTTSEQIPCSWRSSLQGVTTDAEHNETCDTKSAALHKNLCKKGGYTLPHLIRGEYTYTLSKLSTTALERFEAGKKTCSSTEEKLRNHTMELWLKRIKDYEEEATISCCLCHSNVPHSKCIEMAAKLPLPIALELLNGLHSDVRMNLKRSIWKRERALKKRRKLYWDATSEVGIAGHHTPFDTVPHDSHMAKRIFRAQQDDRCVYSLPEDCTAAKDVGSNADQPAADVANLERRMVEDEDTERFAELWLKSFLGEDALSSTYKYHVSPMHGVCWNHGCWRVSICKNGVKHYQYFSIHKLGFFNALKRSIEHRLEHERSMISSNTSNRNQSFAVLSHAKSSEKKVTSVIDTAGVTYDAATDSWVASWYENGKHLAKEFSFAEHGNTAHQRAVKFRTECIRRLYARDDICKLTLQSAMSMYASASALSGASSLKEATALHSLLHSEQVAVEEACATVFGTFRILQRKRKKSWARMSCCEDVTNALLHKAMLENQRVKQRGHTLSGVGNSTRNIQDKLVHLGRSFFNDSAPNSDSLQLICAILNEKRDCSGPYGLYVPRVAFLPSDVEGYHAEHLAKTNGHLFLLHQLSYAYPSLLDTIAALRKSSQPKSGTVSGKQFEITPLMERRIYYRTLYVKFEDAYCEMEYNSSDDRTSPLRDALFHFPSLKDSLAHYAASYDGTKYSFWCATYDEIREGSLINRWKRYFNINYFGYYKSLFMAADYLQSMQLHIS